MAPFTFTEVVNQLCDLQGARNVNGYLPDTRWYDFHTVSPCQFGTTETKFVCFFVFFPEHVLIELTHEIIQSYVYYIIQLWYNLY